MVDFNTGPAHCAGLAVGSIGHLIQSPSPAQFGVTGHCEHPINQYHPATVRA